MRDAIVLLAGGSARRFPGKLEHPIDGRPMILRVFERIKSCGSPVYVAGKGDFSPAVDAALEAPLLVDRGMPEGPLAALLWACTSIRADRIFAIAADQPQLDGELLAQLRAAWRAGDEAVVPEHDAQLEPLAALYDRYALLREGCKLRLSGHNAMRDLIARLATRRLPAGKRYFVNVNRYEDVANVARTA